MIFCMIMPEIGATALKCSDASQAKQVAKITAI
jgi:hypothetical protein